jgi:hypothetical protein
VLANANPTVPKVEQGVIQDDLHILLFHLNDMHRLTLNIEEDMEYVLGSRLKLTSIKSQNSGLHHKDHDHRSLEFLIFSIEFDFKL